MTENVTSVADEAEKAEKAKPAKEKRAEAQKRMALARAASDRKLALEKRLNGESKRLAQDDPVAADPLDPNGKFVWSDLWRSMARPATVGIFFIMACAALDLGRIVLLPVVSGVVIGTMLGPLQTVMSRYRVPEWLSAIVLVLLFIGLINLALTLLAAPIIDWIGKAPTVAQTVKDKLQVFDRPLAALRDLRNAVMPPNNDGTLRVETGPNVLAPAIAYLSPALGELVVFVGTLFFFLLSRNDLRRYLVNFFEDRAIRLRMLRILNDVEQRIAGYLSIVSAINLTLGVLAMILAFIVGLPNPVVFGILAFFLNYIPYLGPLIMHVIFFGVGIVTFSTLGEALIAPACFIALTTLEGHFITPSIVGKRIEMSPFMVFLALAFWTWLWGPVGAFLAVPILIASLVVLEHMFPKSTVHLPG